MKLKFFFSFIFGLTILNTSSVLAHCPLCTAGVAAAAGGAVWLGVSKAIVSLFIGAFAVSTGWWVSRMFKKEHIPFQRQLIIIVSFLLTIVPLFGIITLTHPLYISLAGTYGSLLNRTYLINIGLLGSILGGIIVLVSPGLSKKITKLRRGKHINYQSILVTFALLIITSILIQLFVI